MNPFELPEDHPVRLHHEAARRANHKLDVASEKMVDEYNQHLFDQERELNDLSKDQAEYETAIYAKMKCEMDCVTVMERIPRYQHPLLFRQIAANLIHKADACEIMEAARNKAEQEMNEELAKGERHE